MRHTAYAIVFLMLACICACGTVSTWDVIGWSAGIFSYAALSFLCLSFTYAWVAPGVFGKKATGQHSVRSWLLFAPYFLLNALSSHVYRLISREPAYAEVVPNLFFGRRLTNREVHKAKQHGWVAVLDLAPEFAEVPSLRHLPGYRSLPILDATAPTEQQLHDAIRWLASAVAKGPVYVHCALGHGRTGCVVVAYLVSAGIVKSVADGVQLLQRLRPGLRLNRDQRRVCRAMLLTTPDAGFPR